MKTTELRGLLNPDLPEKDTALIVHALHRMADFEAAVDALERMLKIINALDIEEDWLDRNFAVKDARAVLGRLRPEGVTA